MSAAISAVLDRQRRQLAQAAEAGSPPADGQIGGSCARRNPGLSLRSTSMSVNPLHAEPLQRPTTAPERGQFADPAQRDRRPGLDVVDIGLDGLADLVLPVRLGIDGGLDRRRSVLLVVRPQQLDEALFLAGELARRTCASRCARAGRCRRRWCRGSRARRSKRPDLRAAGRRNGSASSATAFSTVERCRHFASRKPLHGPGTTRYRTNINAVPRSTDGLLGVS